MLNRNAIKLLEFLSKNLLGIAEIFMWAFVSIGFIKLFIYGVVGLSSAVIAICIIFTLIAYAFIFVLFACKISTKTKNKRE